MKMIYEFHYLNPKFVNIYDLIIRAMEFSINLFTFCLENELKYSVSKLLSKRTVKLNTNFNKNSKR